LINQTWFTLSTNKDLSTPIDFKGHGSKDKVTFVLGTHLVTEKALES